MIMSSGGEVADGASLDILDTEEEPNDKEVQAGDDSERNISVD